MINKSVESLIKSDEKGRSEPPTKADIEETIDLLHDFGISVRVPKCTTRKQLYNWRRNAIKDKLSC